MNDDIPFRLIQPDELPALLDLYRHLHATDAPLPDEAELNRIWLDFVHDPKMRCFVGEDNGVLVASCTLVIILNLTRGAHPYGLIENVVTHANYRQKGIGTRLLQHTLAYAWQQGCYKVMLLTGSKREETLTFYEKAGFKRGVKTGFIATPNG